ncbi:PREDICTED: protein sidekick isoform X1 [Polistes dominula]|uniref:Protein sidekick isoform X1 n=1 Tax=Polistes dominula TaxID=743375 RepID=A0ABM1I5P7_POLDO|nr:PREDICTED: protein sidekick isoform X1 [Polistes dominula]
MRMKVFCRNRFSAYPSDISDAWIRKFLFTAVCIAWIISSACATEPLQEPRFTTQPSSSGNILSEHRKKFLQCQARGYPQPKYQWFKNGKPLSNELTSEPYFRIESTHREDAGVYHCVATNSVGSIFSERITFTVAYMGIFEDLTKRVVTVESGSAAILELPPIESHPIPDVTWFTSDGSLLYGIKYATTDHKLLILNASEEDQGLYRARAINTQLGKEENSPFFKLQVIGDPNTEVAPTIIIRPQDTQILKDQDVSYIHCIANARSLHELRTLWTKDGIPIENSRISYSFNDSWNRTLILISANITYNGIYSCHVDLRSGGYATVNASAKVVVYEKPTFITELKRETLSDYGSTVTLSCDAVGVPPPKISWFFNTEPINHLVGSRYEIEEDGSLTIKKLTMDDSGMFQCLASNDAGEASSYTWLKAKKGLRSYLKNRVIRWAAGYNVVRARQPDRRFKFSQYLATSGPIMENGPQNLTVLDGKDVILTCNAIAAPVPNSTWIYNDTIPVEIAGRVQVLENGDLLIAAVKLNDAGKYTCIRANEAGSVNGSAYITVLVRTQIIKPPVDTSVLLGHTAELQCQISNDPSVLYDIAWFHNAQVINTQASQRIKMRHDGTLEIIAVRASDVGEYTCSVVSPGGNETRSARLSVIEIPFAPINVMADRVERISPRTINVTWVPGFDGNSPIKKFKVERREVPELGPIPDPLLNWIVERDNVSAQNRWILLNNLKAAAAYQFRVSAENSVGEGPPSDPSNVVILPQEPPSGPPIGFVGSARSSSEIITQWQPPLEEFRNGHILGYLLRYRLYRYNDSPWTVQNITNEAQRNYLISDLITWKDYIVQIAAYNDKGVGVFTEELKIKTKEGVPEAPPTNVRAKAINSTAVKVWWKPPNPQKINGINQGYKLQAWMENSLSEINEYKVMTVPPSLLDPLAEQSATFVGLKKYTWYNITVLCFTDPGDGEKSSPIEVRTCEDVPEEVENLQFDDISDRALTVKWNPPKEINGILMCYQLKYMIKDLPESLKTENFTADTQSTKVEHLQALTHYKFEVIAWTSVGPGKSKVAIIQSGVEPVLPEPPNKLALSNIDAFSVVLQFTPGFDGNSSITKWTVQAQTTRNSTWYNIYEVSDPDASTISVGGLIPFMQYKLRLIANNVVGPSRPSEPTKEFQTIQAPPSHPPKNVTVRAMSATELRVRWIPLQQIEWYGNPRGYNITYTELRTNISKNITIEDHTANSYILENMKGYALYEIVMQAFNDVGSSPLSPKAIERTRESVPSSGPVHVEANATSSTTILVKWGDVPVEHQNGLIEGFKVYYGANLRSAFQYKNIPSNTTFTTTLTELRKFVQYHVQVLAYTRLGDGSLSMPPVRVQTFEDAPGPPSNVSFPDVSFSTARIIWDTPDDPNGEILAYKVMFHLNNSLDHQFSKEFPASDRTFRATSLEPEKYYMFSVTAQTRLGWGKTAYALVFTTNDRERPQPPSVPQISKSQIQSRQITFSWTPGRDGFAPLRYYTVQQSENSGPFQTIPERVDPSLTSYTANNLKPFTLYQFRIQATNDIGPSDWSTESVPVQTLPAAPSRGVTGLKVVPITTSSVEVYWNTIDEIYWSGDHKTGGYRVVYQPVSDFPIALQATPKEDILGIKETKMILSDLTEDRYYEIIVLPFNSEGEGPPSPPVTVYVGEAVPTGVPQHVQPESISSTEVLLRWKPPQANMQNGDLLGYKIFYLVTDSPQKLEKKQEEEIEVVPASSLTHSLVFLDKYTEYRIQVLAFNPAGDGPRSPAITVRTKQDIPGPPNNLQFSEITMTSLRVSWEPPKMRNGEIIGYVVTYETAEQNDRFSKQVKQKVTETSLLIQSLEEEVMYTFMVRAQTIDFGPPICGNVTTGPQDGSPMVPSNLAVIKTVSSVELQWTNGASGKGPILGYYIETRRKAMEEWQHYDTRWQTIVRSSNGPLTEYTVSYQNLLPSTSYLFRVISYNRYGISYPVYSTETILTPSKLYLEYAYLQHKPFYRQTWFMVTLAATSIIIIIMVIAVLCVKSKSYKYKQEAQKTLEESMAMDTDDRQESDLELYRSRQGGVSGLSGGNTCGTLSKRNTLARKSAHPPPPTMLGKSPPRPSPASVTYHSDEESLKGYDENPDDSSVTEKPSEISSTDSQGSESENESVQSDPHSFVNHYANVNDSLRQSWKRQKPVRNYSSYTDSEPEGSAVVSLNGGQIIMNNMARSRAPLPGFSSFV